jgi:MinD-like ATPase involved in chromosome partitioning or flagellar assembly
MPKIITIHSFRRGTGKSNLAANLAVLLAHAGHRIAVVDTNFQSPGLQTLFDLKPVDPVYTFNNYLFEECAVDQAAFDVTPDLPHVGGRLFVIPASSELAEIARVLRTGYDSERLINGLTELESRLQLDALLIDTPAGLNEETLNLFAACDVLAILLRLDQQDYHGTGLLVRVAQKLNVPRIAMIINDASLSYNLSAVEKEVELVYDCRVAGVLPYSEEMQMLGSDGIFVLRFPDHPLTQVLQHIGAKLIDPGTVTRR